MTTRRCVRTHRRAGFTLVEMMTSLTILGVVMGAVTGTVVSAQRSYVRQRETVRAQEAQRAAQITLATVLRSAGADPLQRGIARLDPDPTGAGSFTSVRVVSDFNPADGDVADPLEDVLFHISHDTLFVRWQAGHAAQPLAFPMRNLCFEYYANDGTPYTVASQVVGATRVKFTLEAPRVPGSSAMERIETWVYLRNRR